MTLTTSQLQILLVGGFGLAGVGIYGLLATRNLIKIIVSLQIMVKGVLVALVAAGAAAGQINTGQSLAVTVIVADTVVAVVGLALAVQVKRHVGVMDVNALSNLQK